MPGQKGQALPLAMLVLAVGTLVVTPFLGHAGASLIGSRTYEQGIAGTYARDAGIEYAIWALQSGTLTVGEGDSELISAFTLNGMTVNVIVDNLGESLYMITSTATGDGGYSATTQAVITGGAGAEYYPGDVVLAWLEVRNGDVLADGNIILNSQSRINGSAYATGDVELYWLAEITGDAVAGDDIYLSSDTAIDGNVSAGDDIYLDWRGEIGGNACSTGDVTLGSEVEIGGDVATTGNMEIGWSGNVYGDVFFNDNTEQLRLLSQSNIWGDVYVTGNIGNVYLDYMARIHGGLYITGRITGWLQIGWWAGISGGVHQYYQGTIPPSPSCPSLPSGGDGVTILSWQYE